MRKNEDTSSMSRSAEGFGVIDNRISSDTYSLNESFNMRSGLAAEI